MAVAAKPESLVVTLADPEATERLAARLAPLLRAGDTVALHGELGTGKTTLARGLIRALCGAGEEVPSPTFTLVQTYAAPDFEIWHFDLYRIERPADALELDIEEATADGVVLIEWPEKLGRWLPAERLDVRLAYGGDECERVATLSGGAGWRARLARLRHG